MNTRPLLLWTLAAMAATAPSGAAQAPTRATSAVPIADAFATETGGALLDVPGVADDFVLFADGQWHERADGSVRWTALAQRLGSVTRDLFVELVFDGRVDPGDPNYPPTGSPITSLLPGAYAPTGPVDPLQWVYFTQVSGTIVGLRAFDGLRVDVAAANTAQVGLGASNKNVLAGLAVDLLLTVQQPPTGEVFAPTGAAALRADLRPSVPMCATHVDADPTLTGAPAQRLGVALPGIQDDYLFLPAAEFVEVDDGTAVLTGTLTSQSDYDDRWQLTVSMSQRVDPGDAQHPPAGMPVLLLPPTTYKSQGGPIDPQLWRYYATATATLVGLDGNAGGQLTLQALAPVQVGTAATQGNVFFGVDAGFSISVVNQPTSRTLAPNGDAVLRCNVATGCILPPPQITAGNLQTIDNVTQQQLTFSGQDLGFVEQAAIGPHVVSTDARSWHAGHVRIVDHQTLELSIPQALPAQSYPLAFLNRTTISNQLQLDLVEPTQPIVRTENDRIGGELQHWITHRGQLQNSLFSVVVLSPSNTPSVAPGVVSLQIGAQFTDHGIIGFALHDPSTGAATLSAPIPSSLAGVRLYAQSVVLDPAVFPLTPTDVWFTDYL